MSLAVVAFGAYAGPRIAVDLATYNFPDTTEGIAVDHTFVLSNVGDQVLVIESAIPGCHCTTAQLDKSQLQPGESVGLRALLDTEGLSGRVMRTITITSNDPGTYGEYQVKVSFVGTVVDRPSSQVAVGGLFYDSYILIDVRDATAYSSGHLAGAMNLPANQVPSRAMSLPPSALVIVYDQDGSQSPAAVQAFQAGGVASVYGLRGGLDLWQKSYGTQRIVTGADASWGSFLDVSGGRAYSTVGGVQLYDITQLRSDYVLIDIRSPSAFAAGHLAGAINLEESAVGAFLGTLQSTAPVIVYSADGSDSDRIVSQLRTHASGARSLLGGFAEWQKQHGDYLVVASAQ